jgi:hypothetical protein
MPDNPYKRHKRVKNMRKVIREHGGKDPGGCVFSAVGFLLFLPFIVTAWALRKIGDGPTYKIDGPCLVVLVGGFAGYAALAAGAWQVFA